MYLESITLIDEGDVIAFTDMLDFYYEGIHEITEEQAKYIEWVRVKKARVLGSLIEIDLVHLKDGFSTSYRVADHAKVIVREDGD